MDLELIKFYHLGLIHVSILLHTGQLINTMERYYFQYFLLHTDPSCQGT
jgi:hypothetical protein